MAISDAGGDHSQRDALIVNQYGAKSYCFLRDSSAGGKTDGGHTVAENAPFCGVSRNLHLPACDLSAGWAFLSY